MKNKFKANLMTIIGIAVLAAYLFTPSKEQEERPTEVTPPSHQVDMDSVRDFDRLNKESLSIVNGILANEEAKSILSQGVVSEFIIKNVSDFNPTTDAPSEYIERNNESIKQLLKQIGESEEPENLKAQIDVRMQITVMINENLKKMFNIITNYNKELKKLNKDLLEFDFKLKEKISVWTFVAKQNGIEKNMEQIINDILKSESSIDSKLRFLFDGWLNKNTKSKLEIYFNIHRDFETALEDFEKIDSLIKEKYKKDYSYGQRYLDNLKK